MSSYIGYYVIDIGYYVIVYIGYYVIDTDY